MKPCAQASDIAQFACTPGQNDQHLLQNILRFGPIAAEPVCCGEGHRLIPIYDFCECGVPTVADEFIQQGPVGFIGKIRHS